MNGRLEKPIYQLVMPLDGIDEVLESSERVRSEQALAALAALRVREPIYADNGEKLQEVGSRDAEPKWMELYRRLREAGWAFRLCMRKYSVSLTAFSMTLMPMPMRPSG